MNNAQHTTRSKNNLADTVFGRLVFLIKLTENRHGK